MAPRISNLADVAAQFLSTIVGRGCYLLLQIYLARSLGPRGFGLYAIGWTVTGLIGTFSPAGMPQAILRYGIAGRHSLRSAPILIAALAGLVSYFVLLATADIVARQVFNEPAAAAVIVALAPSAPLLAVFYVMGSALRTSHASLAAAGTGALVFALYLAIAVGAFSAGVVPSPAAAGHIYTVAILLTLIPTAWLLFHHPAGEAVPALRPLARFGVVTMFIHSANVLNLWADRVVIGVMTDAQDVGLYQVASQLATVAIMLRAAVISVFEARVPKTAAEGALLPDVTKEFLSATRILLHVSAPGLICLALTAPFWTATLFGPAYIAAALPLTVLIAGQLLVSFTGPSTNALHLTRGEGTVMFLTIGTSVMNVVLNVILIPLMGLAGSALASGVANGVLGVASLWYLWRSGRLRLSFGSVGDILLACLASAATTLLITYGFGSSSVIVIGCAVLAAYVAYGSVVAAACQVEDEALDFARAMVRRVRGVQPPERLSAP